MGWGLEAAKVLGLQEKMVKNTIQSVYTLLSLQGTRSWSPHPELVECMQWLDALKLSSSDQSSMSYCCP